jgi:hypothetical protein
MWGTWNALLSVRTWMLGTWMLLWTMSGFLAKWVNGGMDMKVTSGPGRWVAVAALAGTAVFTLAMSMSERMRELMLEPSRREHFQPKPFVFFGLITAVLAVEFAFAP